MVSKIVKGINGRDGAALGTVLNSQACQSLITISAENQNMALKGL